MQLLRALARTWIDNQFRDVFEKHVAPDTHKFGNFNTKDAQGRSQEYLKMLEVHRIVIFKSSDGVVRCVVL